MSSIPTQSDATKNSQKATSGVMPLEQLLTSNDAQLFAEKIWSVPPNSIIEGGGEKTLVEWAADGRVVYLGNQMALFQYVQ